jgi:hypothetical protein
MTGSLVGTNGEQIPWASIATFGWSLGHPVAEIAVLVNCQYSECIVVKEV